MKKFTLFLSALLFSMMSFGAPLGEGYSKVTDITTLSAGDKVVLYCDDAELGVTGWNGNKDANVAATGWVEYVVEAAEGGVYLKDGDQYITGAESANHFKYGEKAVCGVSVSGVLACGSKFLYENDAQYYRMYTDKSSDSKYKPFYVYQVTGEGGGTTPDDGGETPDDGGETPDDGGETPANVTFDFTTEDGLEALGIAYPTTDAGNGAYATDLEEGKAYSQNGISLTAKYGSTATRIWLAANGKLDLRHYKGGVLTFAAPAGKVITNIVFDGADVSGLTTLVDKAWTGNASTVEIPAAADAKTIKINTITVHVADASSDYVATPVISGEADFMDNTTVTITAEEGLEVYYTLDGTDPTNASIKYTAPFELTATTTVKAIAYNGDKASAVVEKKFTKMTILTCAEAVALCTNPATPGQHIIHGYVTEMIEAYNDQYKNITFWMADTPDGGQVLQAFRVKPVSDVEQSLKVGDFVEVIGSLILYTKDGVSIPEVNAGGSVELINAAPSAIDNITINQNATKFIENGQLFIVKDGVRYNALGQVTK